MEGKMREEAAAAVAAEVAELFRLHGDSDYIGEPVSKTEHSVQCAMAAEAWGASESAVLGALLHDVGHLVGLANGAPEMRRGGQSFGAQDHGNLGADWLAQRGFPESVTQFPRGHVLAKKFLCFKDPDYYQKLSAASKETLAFQGGPMTPDEARHFQENNDCEMMVRMRSWDEEAKVPGLPGMPSFDHFAQRIKAFLTAQA